MGILGGSMTVPTTVPTGSSVERHIPHTLCNVVTAKTLILQISFQHPTTATTAGCKTTSQATSLTSFMTLTVTVVYSTSLEMPTLGSLQRLEVNVHKAVPLGRANLLLMMALDLTLPPMISLEISITSHMILPPVHRWRQLLWKMLERCLVLHRIMKSSIGSSAARSDVFQFKY